MIFCRYLKAEESNGRKVNGEIQKTAPAGKGFLLVCGMRFSAEGNFPFDDTDFFQTVIHIGLWSVQRI